MRLFKKIVVLVLCLVSFSCCFVTASADTATTASDGTPIGILTIHSASRFSNSQGGSSSSSSGSDLGHAFLSFKNTTWQSVRLGGINVAAGAECTIGTWDISDHSGIWYNLESYAINNKGKMPNRVSLSMLVCLDDMEKINQYVDSHDAWSLAGNCSVFARFVWNSVSDICLSGDTPSALASSIKSQSGYEINRYVPNASPCGYVKHNWNDAIFISVNPANIITNATTSTVMIVPIEEDVSL